MDLLQECDPRNARNPFRARAETQQYPNRHGIALSTLCTPALRFGRVSPEVDQHFWPGDSPHNTAYLAENIQKAVSAKQPYGGICYAQKTGRVGDIAVKHSTIADSFNSSALSNGSLRHAEAKELTCFLLRTLLATPAILRGGRPRHGRYSVEPTGQPRNCSR
jgi:hypothetical protein